MEHLAGLLVCDRLQSDRSSMQTVVPVSRPDLYGNLPDALQEAHAQAG